jgi:hypothetical protein
MNTPNNSTTAQANKSLTEPSDDNDYGYDEDNLTLSSSADSDTTNSLRLQAMTYLSDVTVTLSSLQTYPAVQAAFVRYNTSLPSSAAVERLFSCAGLIASSRRNRLNDLTFEKLLLLKSNGY